MALNFAELETVYENLAIALDTVSDAQREVLLCKLSLLMARELGDLATVQEMIQTAKDHLDRACFLGQDRVKTLGQIGTGSGIESGI